MEQACHIFERLFNFNTLWNLCGNTIRKIGFFKAKLRFRQKTHYNRSIILKCNHATSVYFKHIEGYGKSWITTNDQRILRTPHKSI
ncbi:hypothetical protein SADUNF_Sadunf11G0002100 [Salix dunnii]|uniref:Uncharacterized protein n=1 Tax=Salix dunnii TaxID=1413687 RepID=A0A835MWG0_9ROSI|nr:hypothetical protein SADUNF_Sadunf11G0002100 [Salix dunnii]